MPLNKIFCNLYIDDELGIEAYIYRGAAKRFPSHFHKYYEVGFIEHGDRLITCQSMEYKAVSGDIILFNPDDKHSCEAVMDDYLDYRCIHISTQLLSDILKESYADKLLSPFPPVIYNNETLYGLLKDLHQMILDGKQGIEKEEQFLLFLHELFNLTPTLQQSITEERGITDVIKTVSDFMEKHFTQNITLDLLCEISGFSKYYFIRSFTQIMGISPYCYITALRVKRAQELLQTDMSLSDIALELGYSHQSHFSNAFKNTVGMTPKQYGDIYKLNGTGK